MNVTGLTTEQIASMKTWAESKPDLLDLYLFGSRVVGGSRPDSDLDVAFRDVSDYVRWDHIESNDPRKKVWTKELAGLTGLRIHLHHADPRINVEFWAEIQKGVLIFSRD